MFVLPKTNEVATEKVKDNDKILKVLAKAKKAANKVLVENLATVGISAKGVILPKKEKKAAPKPIDEEQLLFDAKKIAKVIVVDKAETKNKKQKPQKEVVMANETAIKPIEKTDTSFVAITFNIRFSSTYGQTLHIYGNHVLLGNNIVERAVALNYVNENLWSITITFPTKLIKNITYNYVLKSTDGSVSIDADRDKNFNPSLYKKASVSIYDAWNHTGYIENAFYTEPFKNVLLHQNVVIETASKKLPKFTHILRVKTPLLPIDKTLCVVGSCKTLANWKKDQAIVLNKSQDGVYFEAYLNLQKEQGTIEYKYGIYDLATKTLVEFEKGKNRYLAINETNSDTETIVNDGFAVLNVINWKGAGVAIPVFSLKTNNSFGVGEFTDIKLLVDWSKKVGLKLIQLLPINDTIATHTWLDSYPYAAISAFALHPIYVNIAAMANKENSAIVATFNDKQKELNALPALDYEVVLDTKWKLINQLFTLQKTATFATKDYQSFFNNNRHWLVPYAAFSYLRDTYNTPDFNKWPEYTIYTEDVIETLVNENVTHLELHYFVQFHLHTQLKAATQYAHKNGIIVKGDIAIGIYRFGADAWQQPNLYHMNVQAGAPPDDFAIKGQNWGFPTYNWQAMKQDGFAWWKQRFEQMSHYFDAFRIDHILGFFRIWSIPMDAVEGIMGYFVPAIPVHVNEFYSNGIWFDYNRYTKPYITENVLWQIFGYENDFVKNNFLQDEGYENYSLLQQFNTQRKVEAHFDKLEQNDFNTKIKIGLYDLISNVILFEVEGSQGQQFHFRFGMQNRKTFTQLEQHTRTQLNNLYVDYFFKRQDNFWKQEALQKLPALKRVTNMLVCGEDLGLVPDCLPDVMKQLGLLSLEIQRMPKDSTKQFFHPNDAPYLSVVTPSTHDMSTIRGWWEENKASTQRFFNHELGQWGDAPINCSGFINKAIVEQHLYSPAMWSVFQLQDILGIDENIRLDNASEERINLPSNPKNYWKYRMHLFLEELLDSLDFNTVFTTMIKKSGRA